MSYSWVNSDRIHRAGLFAHAAIDASQLVDIELGRVFFAIGPGRFLSLDMNAPRRTGRAAHETGHALHPPLFIFVQPMNATIGSQRHPTLLDRQILALLLRILHRLVLVPVSYTH